MVLYALHVPLVYSKQLTFPQDGYHLSELNYPVTSLTCLSPAKPAPSRLPLCLNIDQHRYGLVTAMFTVGGLLGSVYSSSVVKTRGIKGGIQVTGHLNILGVALMTLAPHWTILSLGRYVLNSILETSTSSQQRDH